VGIISSVKTSVFWEVAILNRTALGTIPHHTRRAALGLIVIALTAGAAPTSPVERPPGTDFYGDPLPPGARARLGTIQLRHYWADMAFSADGKALISCGQDGALRRWSLVTGKQVWHKQLWRLRTDSDYWSWIKTLSSGGNILAVREKDGVYLYDTARGEEQGRLPVSRTEGIPLKFSPDGKILAVQTHQKQGEEETIRIQLWDVPGRKKGPVLTLKNTMVVMAGPFFSQDGKILALMSLSDGLPLLTLWDTATGRKLGGVSAEKQDLGQVLAISPDGKTAVTVTGLDETVSLWATDTLEKPVRLQPSPAVQWTSCGSSSLAFSPDGSLLAVGGKEDIRLWDVAARKERRRLPDRGVSSIVFAPHGKTLACRGSGNAIHLWDVSTGRQLHPRPGHGSAVTSLAVSPDGKVVASGSDSDEPVLHLWDAATGKPLHLLRGHDQWIYSCAFSPDGKWVVSGGNEGAFQLWDAATGKKLRRMEIPVPQGQPSGYFDVRAIRVSPDGKRLAAIGLENSQPEQAQVYVWDTATGKLLARRPFKADVRTQVMPNSSSSRVEKHAAFTPDGEGVTVRMGKGLSIEDTTTGRLLATLPEGVGRTVVFSPDGQLVAAGVLKPMKDPFEEYQLEGFSLMETATGQEVLRLKTGNDPLAAFSPDGRLFVASDEEALHVWDVGTGERLFRRPWTEEAGPASSLVFLPNGRTVATGLYDGTILVWDLEPRTGLKSPIAKDLGRQELDALWADLAGDARTAHRTLHALAATPARAVPMLKDQLRPAEAVPAGGLSKLLAELDSDQFTVREQAAKELGQLSERVEPALRRLLQDKPPLEVRNRVEAILAGARPVPPAATLRGLRAIQVLERIGTPEARGVLRNLARGAAARETREAKAALERLAARTPLRR
jgi:WD40 repeat protein